MLVSMFDAQFVEFIRKIEGDIRESILEIYSHPKSKLTVFPADVERNSGESDGDHNKRLIVFVEKQCTEMQDLLSCNTTLAEELAKKGGRPSSPPDHRASRGSERDVVETQRIEILEKENAKLKSESSMYPNLAADHKSLSDAYNSLELSHFNLERELEALKSGPIKAEGREDTDAELNDLLICLGQEQSKVDCINSKDWKNLVKMLINYSKGLEMMWACPKMMTRKIKGLWGLRLIRSGWIVSYSNDL